MKHWVRVLAIACLSWIPTTAAAVDVLNLELGVGSSMRHLAPEFSEEPLTRVGGRVSVRAELQLPVFARVEARMLSAFTSKDIETPTFELNSAISSRSGPGVALDVHELSVRRDRLLEGSEFLVQGGPAYVLAAAGRLKLGGGVGVLNVTEDAMHGKDSLFLGYVGAEHAFRGERLDTTVRWSWSLFDRHGDTTLMLRTDADAGYRIGGRALEWGPRVRVAYLDRRLGRGLSELYSQVQADVGLFVRWGLVRR